MTTYIAGRIRGTTDYHARFAKAADKLRAQGKSVFNPAAANLEGMSLDFIMKYLLPQLCDCDEIALLPWWWTRFGGTWVEVVLAIYLKKKIIRL